MDISSVNHLATPTANTPQPAEPPPATQDQRALIHAVKAVNSSELFGQENELTFVLDRNTHRAIVRIVNRNTRQVVQQIPAEYVLRLAEEFQGK